MPRGNVPLYQELSTSGVWASWFKSVADLLQGKIPVLLPSFTVSGVPSASDNPNGLIYVSNETGGAVLAFSDGTNWRRVTDRAIIS